MTDSRDYRKYLDKCFELTEEKQRLRQTGINAQFREVNHVLNDINEHIKKQNGSIAELRKESNDRKLVVDEFHEFKGKFVWIKNKWYIVLLGLIICILVINILYDFGAIDKIVDKLINKI
jgi:hypothetical protein